MKRAGNTVYWIYFAGVLGSVVLTTIIYWNYHLDKSGLISPFIGQFNLVDVILAVMISTLIYGLIVVLPLLIKKQDEESVLSSRAAELEVAVVTDPLTGLYNRRYFEDALDEYFIEFSRNKTPLALLALDLDHFKSVNDSYGHDVGDVVLKRIAAKLKSLTREHDIVARTGGEEFCIVAPFSDEGQIEPFAERIRQAIDDMRIDLDERSVNPTVSIGVASTVEGHKSPKLLWKVSDKRLFNAKAQGRNRVCSYEQTSVSFAQKIPQMNS